MEKPADDKETKTAGACACGSWHPASAVVSGSSLFCDDAFYYAVFQLFETWGNQCLPDRYFVENILLFLPFGALLPAAVPFLRRWWYCVYAAFATSMMLETVQLLTERGFCQLDDVVTNTLGAAIGYLVFALVRKCWRGKIEE